MFNCIKILLNTFLVDEYTRLKHYWEAEYEKNKLLME